MNMVHVWKRSAPRAWQHGILVAALFAVFMQTGTSQLVSKAPISGEIDHLLVNDLGDKWSGGYIVVGGQNVIVPRNLLIDLPANRLTLQELFTTAPASSQALGESGLALSDLSARGRGAHVEIHANRLPSGNIIAGEIFIAKGIEEVTGEVTYIDWDDGYLRVNGDIGSDDTGVMIRINDPTGRYTVQKGKGCRNGPNCSPDPRFGVDPDNYTVTFMTGYPACLPSTTILRNRTGYLQGVDPAGAGADSLGENDPWCPCENRDIAPVPDSTRFAPILLGDTVAAEGNFERIKGSRFLSAHTVTVFDKLMTRNDPTQPDYMIFDEISWAVPGYQEQGMAIEFLGHTTLPDSQLDMFKLHVDPSSGATYEYALSTTFGNPAMVHAGVFPNETGIFAGEYELSFVFENEVGHLPCVNILNGGLFNPNCANPAYPAWTSGFSTPSAWVTLWAARPYGLSVSSPIPPEPWRRAPIAIRSTWRLSARAIAAP